MVLTTIIDKFQKVMNPFRGPIDDRWGQYLSNDDRREIARYLADNIDIIEEYLGPINRKNKDEIYKLLKYIEKYGIYEQLLSQQIQPQQHYINYYTPFGYVTSLKSLDEIIKNIKEGYLSSLPQYPNVIKPSNDYIEIIFGIYGNPKLQKETLIEILKDAIGGIMVRGYPAFYYDPSRYNNHELPLIYYVQRDNDSFLQIFFINKMKMPPKITGYLLHELSNIIQPKRKSLIFPSGNQYYIIKDYLDRYLVAIDLDPSKDPYILQSYQFFYGYQEFASRNKIF
jgi:hypothetical protein